MFYARTISKEEIVRLLENQAYQLHHAADGIATIEKAGRRRKLAWRSVAAVIVRAVIVAVELIR